MFFTSGVSNLSTVPTLKGKESSSHLGKRKIIFKYALGKGYVGFLKWWYPTTMGFPTKNDHFGVWNGGTTIFGNIHMLVPRRVNVPSHLWVTCNVDWSPQPKINESEEFPARLQMGRWCLPALREKLDPLGSGYTRKTNCYILDFHHGSLLSFNHP